MLPLLNSMPLSRVERIEVLRGPVSVLYGTDAYIGVINVITKSQATQSPSIAFKAGSYGTYAGDVALEKDLGDLKAVGGMMALTTSGWPYTLTDEKGVTNTIPETMTNVGGDLDLRYKGLTSYTFVGSTNPQDVGQPPVWGNPISTGVSVFRILSDISYSTQLTDIWNASINMTYNHMSLGQGYTAAKENDYHYFSDDFLFESDHHITLNDNIHLAVGGIVELQMGKGEENALTSGLQPFNLFSGPNPDPFIVVPFYRRAPWDLYLQLEWKILDSLKMIAGGQLNKSPDVSLDYVPRLGLVANLPNGWGSKLLYGEAYRSAVAVERGTQTPNDLYGNDSLSPETIRTIEAQFSFRRSSYGFALTYFNSFQSDVIGRTLPGSSHQTTVNGQLSPPGVPVYVNGGASRSQGVEFEGHGAISKAITTFADVTYIWTVDRRGMPLLQAKMGVVVTPIDPLHISAYDDYFGRFGNITADQPNTNHPVGSYHDVSLNLEYDASKWLLAEGSPHKIVFNLAGKNLFNEPIYFPEFLRRVINSFPGGPGITVYGGVTATY